MHRTRSKLTIAAALGGVVAVALALGAGNLAAAPSIHARVLERLTFVERELASPTVDLGKHGFTPLDRQVIASEILDLQGHLVGRFDSDCGITAVGKRAGAVCSSVITFKNGQIVGTRFASLTGPDTSPQPITGGSGAYLGAKGQIRLLHKTKLGLEFVIELTR
jgi:hypothetical protein